jgi:cell division protein FtsB
VSAQDWTNPSWSADHPPSPPYYRPRNRRHLIRRRLLELAAGAAALWIVYAFVFSDYGLQNMLVLKKREAALENEIAAMQARYEALKTEKVALSKDPATLERVAREDFKMGRPGERTYIFVPVDSLGAPLPQEHLR